MRYPLVILILMVGLLTPLAAADRWQDLFDGKTLSGWAPKAVHGGKGGVWVVEKGLLVGNQHPDHTGGLLGTDAKFEDVEVDVEFQADFPVDSGLFLRTREDGMGYQVTIDYRKEGSVGAIYAPAEGGFLAQSHGWEKAYNKTGWNRLRVRIEGQPAKITAYLNGEKTVEFQDTRERYPRSGYIGLQVHGGKDSWGENSRVRFRHVRVRDLRK